ncbi:MAG: YitT family protein [Candidatus Limivicinus sp.]
MKMLESIKAQSKRIFMSLFGVLIGGVCVGFMKTAAFGVDPFQVLVSGLDHTIPIDFGTLYVLINAVLLLFSLIADRHNIGIATFINLFLLGYVVDFTKAGLEALFPAPGMVMRIGFMVLGIVVLCIGSALYMTADLGVSTYDAVAIVMSKKWKWGQFRYVRICTDLVCVLLGGLLIYLASGSAAEVAASVGVGTIVTAFFMGPLIEFFNEKIARPMLGQTTK